ncbi:WNT1-inducible-signaling pathway protein 2-like isoform X2 [Cynoglossus semilaevis]|uniref:WNT1-inducible-signaling pathway protein 2-like isoform X2 n=1 Tax=Cynoglossus semilaevis TaxID=244447 RepID=UPI000D62B30A|nr:WNT1-inducible-signaling pathway protein 2-like isoform X2 [Cynoglossus semilaevis]
MNPRQRQLLCSLLLCTIPQVCCQLCTRPCQCPSSVPQCPAGVPLMLDSCGCCQVCSRQESEACTQWLPCDTQRGLQCDYSASFPGGPGQCVGRNELGCEINGRRLEEGHVFQPSCARLCRCLGGGLSCVSLCSDDLHKPADQCHNPQLLRLPGRCCKEWVCDGLDNRISSNPSEEQTRQERRGGLAGPLFGPISNCIEWTSDWSLCSHSCGPGVSTRTTTRNRGCRLQTETRLCQIRPCQTLLPGIHRVEPGLSVCDGSFTSPVSLTLEHQGCRSLRAYRPKFCALTCPERGCCSPSHTRTVWLVFRCSQGRLIQHQVMMIESCSCTIATCRHNPATASRGVRRWL